MAQDLSSPYLEMWKDWNPAVYIEERNAERKWVPATGLVGCTFRVSETEQGAPIGGLTNIAATHVAGDPGTYEGAVDLAVLTSELPEVDYPHDTKVYLQLLKADDIVVEAFEKVIKRLKY